MASDDFPDDGPDPGEGLVRVERPGGPPAIRDSRLAEVRDVAFPIAMRGYDRQAVDAYVVRVNQLIAELEAASSPQGAVKRALERVGEETAGILQRANETAEAITARSQAQADERLREAAREADAMTIEAEHDAEAITADAEARVQELEGRTETLRRESGQLVEDARESGRRLTQVAEAARRRLLGGDETEELPVSSGHPTGPGGSVAAGRLEGEGQATAPMTPLEDDEEGVEPVESVGRAQPIRSREAEEGPLGPDGSPLEPDERPFDQNVPPPGSERP